MSNYETQEGRTDIAVVGMAGRFPGARNVAEFWRNVRDGVVSISCFTKEELASAGVGAELLGDTRYVRAGGVLEDAEMFDADFFGFTPREAETADPQQRCFLECVWEALEDAGYDPALYDGRIGVYAGQSLNTYLLNLYSRQRGADPAELFQLLIGNEKDHLPTRVSYKLNLNGPSINVQTSCSTSLVAIVTACEALLDYRCDIALAGAAAIRVPTKKGYLYEEGGIMSPDGTCRPFDASARGTVGGDGVGVVVLKRLEDALASGDNVHAIIKGMAVNNDGANKVGYTAPSIDGQAEVIAEALAFAGVEPESVSYVEAHGTGTPLGDPVELSALGRVFGEGKGKGFCAVGSVKANIGHLDAAAGVAGLLKTVLALKHKQLPPSPCFERPNPHIDFADSPFCVNTELKEWARGETPRRAGVSSFGIGGTNAHVLLEEAAPTNEDASARPEQLFILSARTETALEASTTNLAAHLREGRVSLADAAYTLQVGRRAFKRRRAFVSADAAEALAALEHAASGAVWTDEAEEGGAGVVFMFPGQGAQHVEMARGLYETEPLFRELVGHCAELLRAELGFDLREVLYPEAAQMETAAALLDETYVTQPALFVIEYALASLWMSRGVRPAALIGHSVGEYVAACLAGVFSLEDGLRLVAARGSLMQSCEAGAMLAAALKREEVAALLERWPGLSLAADNAPSEQVFSGRSDDVESLSRELEARGVSCRRLRTSRAFHSAMLDGVCEEFAARVRSVELSAPRLPFISNLTGTWIEPHEATSPVYWTKHLRQPVRFAEGVAELLKEPARLLLEVGPGRALGSLASRQGAKPGRVFASLPHRGERAAGAGDVRSMLEALGRLWVAGAEVDWKAFSKGERRRRVSLPTYPFERERYWVEPEREADAAATEIRAEAEARRAPEDWFYVPVWRQTPPAEFLQPPSSSGAKASRVVFLDEAGLGSRLVAYLTAHGDEVFDVSAGERFEQMGATSYAINPRRAEDYHALLEALGAEGERLRHFVHLWGVTREERDAEPGDFEEAQHAGFLSLLFLAQALGGAESPTGARVAAVTSGVQRVTGEERLSPAKATSLGACRVIPQEVAGVECRAIDVSLNDAGAQELENLAAALAAELNVETSARLRTTAVAYRRGQRWEQEFAPVRLSGAHEGVSPLREGGVYLVTGGQKGFSAELTRWLAGSLHARVALVARNRFAGREALEACGEVLCIEADVSDETQMREALSRVRSLWGEVNGVFHAEESESAGLLQLRTPALSLAALGAKAGGALVLGRLLREARPDFLLLCSSTASLTGMLGQVDYCAANAFLDAFAHAEHARGVPLTLSVNWGLWGESAGQEETLPAGAPQVLEELRRSRERWGISAAEGVEALRRILQRGVAPQVIVSAQDFGLVRERQQGVTAASLLESLGAARRAGTQESNARAYVAPLGETEEAVAAVWCEVFGLSRVGADDNFFELGGNSLLGLQLVSRLRKLFFAELPMSTLFERPTVRGLAAAVSESRLRARELEEITHMLSNIEGLSAEEVRLLLAHDAADH